MELNKFDSISLIFDLFVFGLDLLQTKLSSSIKAEISRLAIHRVNDD